MMFGKLAHDPVRAFCKHPAQMRSGPWRTGGSSTSKDAGAFFSESGASEDLRPRPIMSLGKPAARSIKQLFELQSHPPLVLNEKESCRRLGRR